MKIVVIICLYVGMVDKHDLGSCEEIRVGSNPTGGTKIVSMNKLQIKVETYLATLGTLKIEEECSA